MLDGLLGRLGGETTALLVWAALAAFLAALVWVVMVVWRGGDLPLRSYRTPDGQRHTGALVWLGIFVLVLTWLPLGILGYRAVVAIIWSAYGTAMWIGRHWPLWLVLAAAYGVWRIVRTYRITPTRVRAWTEERRETRQPTEALPELPHDPIPHGAARTDLPVGARPDGTLVYAPPPTVEPVPDEAWARPSTL